MSRPTTWIDLHHATLETPLYDTNMTFTTSVAAVFWLLGCRTLKRRWVKFACNLGWKWAMAQQRSVLQQIDKCRISKKNMDTFIMPNKKVSFSKFAATSRTHFATETCLPSILFSVSGAVNQTSLKSPIPFGWSQVSHGFLDGSSGYPNITGVIRRQIWPRANASGEAPRRSPALIKNPMGNSKCFKWKNMIFTT